MQPLGHADPAPSRLNYRMQRLMLTPLFWVFLRVALPMLVTGGLTFWYLSDEGRRAAIWDTVEDLRAQIESRPEFMVQLMAIDGAETTLAEEIRATVPLNFPISSFDLDLDRIRDEVSALSAVTSATVRIQSGGILQIDVVPRVPVAIWRQAGGLMLVDASGVQVRPIEARADRADLPVLAGDGADRAVDEALRILRAAQPLAPRIRGLVRMGERRWDLVLDRDQRVLLPEVNPIPALQRVIAQNEVQDLLARDVAAIDMRLAHRPTLRMTQAAQEEHVRIKSMQTGDR